jgi:hypothetical protein
MRIVIISATFLFTFNSCIEQNDKQRMNELEIKFSKNKHTEFYPNGNLKAEYYTDSSGFLISPYVHFDSLGKLKDSSWLNYEGNFEFQKIFENGQLVCLQTNFVSQNRYLDMMRIILDENLDTIHHKSDYCKIIPRTDTININERFSFDLVINSSEAKGEKVKLTFGNFDKNFHLIDSTNYRIEDITNTDYAELYVTATNLGWNKLRIKVWVADLKNDNGVLEYWGKEYYLEHDFFVK